MKKRRIIIGVVMLLLLIILFPITGRYKDGGSVDYEAIVYKVTIWHTMPFNYKGFHKGCRTGTTVELFHLFTVYDTSKYND